MAAVSVRRAVREDGPDILELIRQLGYEAESSSFLPLLGVLIKRDEHEVLVADDGVQAVGFVNVNFRTFLRYGALVGTVDELCVDEEHRGHGVGQALIEAGIAAGRKRGAHHLELTTNKVRADALRFYERLGFEITSHKLVYSLSGGPAHMPHVKEKARASR